MTSMDGARPTTRDVEALDARRMGEKGWGAPTWPKAYGGGGLSPAAGARAAAGDGPHRRAATRSAAWASMMFGPTLLEYGNEEQKQQHIPRHRHAARCAGARAISEPGAGSDLASLADQGRGQGRPLPGQRPEDLDLAARSSPTGASAWCAPTPPRSTRASASC